MGAGLPVRLDILGPWGGAQPGVVAQGDGALRAWVRVPGGGHESARSGRSDTQSGAELVARHERAGAALLVPVLVQRPPVRALRHRRDHADGHAREAEHRVLEQAVCSATGIRGHLEPGLVRVLQQVQEVTASSSRIGGVLLHTSNADRETL